MNNDTASAASRLPLLPSSILDQLASAPPTPIASAAAGTNDATPAPTKLKEQRSRRVFFLDDLIRSLDILVYCHLSVLYYMDCSTALLFLRIIPHWLFLTPKPPHFPRPPPHRPYASTIVLTALVALLAHSLVPPPEAGEASRGYLHGSLLLDFVGEKSPASRVRLLATDTIIVALQFVLMVAQFERTELRKAIDGPATPNTDSGTTLGTSFTAVAGQDGASTVGETGLEQNRQDLDAEEQGILRATAEAAAAANARLAPERRRRESREKAGAKMTLEEQEEDEESAPRPGHHLDAFYSGQAVVANLHIFDSIRSTWRWRYNPSSGQI